MPCFSCKDETGKRKTEWVNTGIPTVRGNKRRAEQRLAEIITERERKQKARDGSTDIPFVDYIDLWLETAKSTFDTVTYEGYKSYIVSHIRPYFANLTLQDVNINHIDGYFRCKASSGRLDGKKGGLSRSSIEKHKAVLSRMFGDAMREPFNLKDNPCRYAKIPKSAVKCEKHITFYTVEQCRRLLEVTAGTPLHDMIYLTFMYGLRRSELMGLKWDAIDFSGGTVSINHTVVVHNIVVEKDKTKNASSNRTYPILDDVMPLLLRIKAAQNENSAFFGNCYIYLHKGGRLALLSFLSVPRACEGSQKE